MKKYLHLFALLSITVFSAAPARGAPGETASAVAPSVAPTVAPESTAATKPNIILILTDDQDRPSLARMPNVQSLLVKQGMTLARHYVTLSLCCPSRVSGLRGQFAHNTTILQNIPPEGGFEGTYSKGLEQSTIATWLQAAGYRTALFGKYLNGYPNTAPSPAYIPPGWTEWYSPNGGSPYNGFKYDMNENGSTVHYGDTDADYMTDVLSNKAVDFITRSIEQHGGQPFFAYIAPYAPHAPATPAPRHANAYPGILAPRGASFNEADVSDKPQWLKDMPSLTTEQIKAIDDLYRKRLQSLLAVDELVANVVNTLQSRGRLANTYIVFTSDNGFHQGQHRMESGKMTPYEEDLRLPMVVRGPGIARRSTSSYLTSNVDYAPTFAEMAGITAPDFIDGRSLLPLLKGVPQTTWRQALLLEHKLHNTEQPPLASPDDGLLEPPDAFEINMAGGSWVTGFTGLRTLAGHTYVEYETNEFELYDNLLDPAQLTNAYPTAPTELKNRLATWLASLKDAAGAALRQAEETMPVGEQTPAP